MIAAYTGAQVSAGYVAGAAARTALSPALHAASSVVGNPTVEIDPGLTTLFDGLAPRVASLPVGAVLGSVASFLDRLNPITIAITATTATFAGVGCAAFD